MTAQFWLWVVLSGLGGGIVGWWTRGRQVSGRELTIRRELNNRLCAVEDDARRSLGRAQDQATAKREALTEERDALQARLVELGAPDVPAPTVLTTGSLGSAPPVRARDRPSRRPRKPHRSSEGAATPRASTNRDDLKRIKGIGPAFEEFLNDMGYTTFLHVARWSPEEIEQLAEHLGARIRLEEWSARAGELHNETNGASL